MNILCLDTSTSILSIALQIDKGTFLLEADMGGKHSGLLQPALEGLCATAGVKGSDLDVAACMRGPGSFTGIRIGFAAVQGIAAGCGARAVSIPTLDCIALPFADAPVVLPAIDSKRRQFYTAVYRNGNRVTDYLDVKPDALVPLLAGDKHILFAGPDAAALCAALCGLLPEICGTVSPCSSYGQAKNMLYFLQKKSTIYTSWDGTLSVPLYIRKSDAEEKWQK
jgi:tRNA threonylcarbamoyladenosine biosynthesis protein TsaB